MATKQFTASSYNNRMFSCTASVCCRPIINPSISDLDFLRLFLNYYDKAHRAQYRVQILEENINYLTLMASSSPFKPIIKITNLQDARSQADSHNSTPPHASRFPSLVDRSAYLTTPVITYLPLNLAG
jgi:hypothetical protein